MSPPSPRRAAPTLVALALLAGLLAVVLRARAGGRMEACGPTSGAPCARGEDSGAGPAPGRPDGRTGPYMPASEVCDDAGYLCADLASDTVVVVRRWTRKGGVLVVRVPLPKVEDRVAAQALQRAATAGVRAWNGHPYPVLVDERGTRSADVVVRWTPVLPGAQLGVTRTQWSPTAGLKVLALELATRSPSSGGALDPRQVRLTAAHEMGHALGLPHSDDPRDLMYPKNTATSLTARDYRTLEALYDLPDGTRIVPRQAAPVSVPPG